MTINRVRNIKDVMGWGREKAAYACHFMGVVGSELGFKGVLSLACLGVGISGLAVGVSSSNKLNDVKSILNKMDLTKLDKLNNLDSFYKLARVDLFEYSKTFKEYLDKLSEDIKRTRDDVSNNNKLQNIYMKGIDREISGIKARLDVLTSGDYKEKLDIYFDELSNQFDMIQETQGIIQNQQVEKFINEFKQFVNKEISTIKNEVQKIKVSAGTYDDTELREELYKAFVSLYDHINIGLNALNDNIYDNLEIINTNVGDVYDEILNNQAELELLNQTMFEAVTTDISES